MENSEKSYSHVLQKVGLLKNFSVAKVVSRKEIEDLKKLIRAVAKDEKEYEKMFEEEMAQIANMHNPKAPIPGIIYVEDKSAKLKPILDSAKKEANRIKGMNLSKRDVCFLIASVIKELGLTQEDFLNLNEELNGDDEEKED